MNCVVGCTAQAREVEPRIVEDLLLSGADPNERNAHSDTARDELARRTSALRTKARAPPAPRAPGGPLLALRV